MRILVTGGAGFIGSHLVKRLLDDEHDVMVFDNFSTGNPQNVDNSAEVLCGSCEDYYEMDTAFKIFKPEIVFHLAGQPSVEDSILDPQRDMDWNYKSMVVLVHMAKKFGVQKIIFSSTSAVYGEQNILPIVEDTICNPISPYGLHKLMAEKFLQMSGVDYTIFRFGNVYGEKGNKGVIYNFCNNGLFNNELTIEGSGKQTRDFIYVGDIVEGLIKAMARGSGVFNLASNTEISIEQLANLVKKIFKENYNKEIKINYTAKREGDIQASRLDTTKAETILNWKPKTKLEKGIKKVIQSLY